jgi:hypothetical protein
MARQYLAEGLKGAFPFIADVKNIVVESLPNGKIRTRIPGRFSVCDCVNGNGRRYGRHVWEKNLDTTSTLMESIRRNAAFGLLEHPKDGQVTLLSPISHLVTEAKLQRGQNTAGKEIWEVVGEIQVLGTEEGKKLTALIEAGYNPLVSSRGFGSLVRATDGVDDVQDDYVCEGWDVVIKPSFETAELNPPRETILTTTEAASPQAASPSPAATITENKPPVAPPAAAKPNLEPAACAPVPAPGPTPVKTTNESSQDKTMNLNEIKQAIASFRSTEARKLQPKQFAEGMAQLGALHQEVANYLAEDTKRSWQATQLQEEITAIEAAWNETQLAPVKTAAKLNENNTKLMHVIKAVAKTGLSYKNQLGESVKQATRQSALLNEVVERGRAWRQVAKVNESAAAKYKRRFMMASETLTQLADKYKSDVVELGRRVITLEFGDKAQTPDIQKMLKEATKPKRIVEIRNILEGKTTAAACNASKQPTVAPPVAEGRKPAAPPAGNPAATVSEGVTILSQAPKDPRGLTEAVGMVNRLSKAMVQG